MTKKNALGRGLGALIDSGKYEIAEVEKKGNINEIDISLISVNPFQPRTDFEQEHIDELAASIQKYGIIQPITVRKMNDKEYQLISGERRLRASKQIGLTVVPAFVREVEDQELLELALVENIQRQDLNPIEIAISYQRLTDECNISHLELSERVGKNRTSITNYMRLLKLPPEIQFALRNKSLSVGHARALINIENVDIQKDIFNKIIEQELSVRETENLVKEVNEPKQKIRKERNTIALPENIINFQQNLSEKFNTKVSLARTENGKGKIVINFNSDTDLDYIMQIINK